MSENVNLPTTVAEYHRALRKAHLNGAAHLAGMLGVALPASYKDLVESAARSMYPIAARMEA